MLIFQIFTSSPAEASGPWCPYSVHLTLRGLQVVFVNRIVALEHRHRFVPGDLHGRERIDTRSAKICRGCVAQVVKDDIGQPCLAADAAKDFANRLDGTAATREYMAMRVKCDRYTL